MSFYKKTKKEKETQECPYLVPWSHQRGDPCLPSALEKTWEVLGCVLEVDILFSIIYQVQFSCLPPTPIAVGVGLNMLRSWGLRPGKIRDISVHSLLRGSWVFLVQSFMKHELWIRNYFQIFWLTLISESNLGTDKLTKARCARSGTVIF